MTSKSLFLLLIITLFTKFGIAQKAMSLISKTPLPKSNRKIIETYLNQNSGDFLQLFEEESRMVKIQKGQFAGYNVFNANHGFILPNGNEFMLRANEAIIASTNEYFLTNIVDYENGKIEFAIYQQINGGLQLIGKRGHYSVEGSRNLMDNGLVIISDESEGFGTFVELYNKNFEALNSYVPFQDGFSEGLFTNTDSMIVGVFKSASAGTVKMVFFSPFTGKVLDERIISISTSLQLLQSAKEYFLIYGYDNNGSDILTCLNRLGEILWDKPFVLPNFDIYNDGERVFLFTKTELVSITAKSGVINWRMNLKKLSNISSIPSATETIRLTAINFDENFIDVIFSQTRKGTLTYSDKKLNSQFVRLNVNGEIEARIALSLEANDLKIDKSKPGIGIIQDQETLKYEL